MATQLYDLNNADQRSSFTAKVRQWITDATALHNTMVDEWNTIEDRLNSEFTVAGFSDDPLGQLGLANSKTVNPSEVLPVLTRVPRSRPNHESVLGNFVNLDRRLIVTARTPRDKSIANIIRERLKYIEDVNMLKENVYFPMMDGTFGKGLHWITARFNGNIAGGINKFEVDEISCRDVLVDPRSRGQRFKTGQYRIMRFVMEKEDAEARFGKYELFDPDRVHLSSTDYDKAYKQQNLTSQHKQATFYYGEFFTIGSDYVYIDPKTREVLSISKQEFDARSKDPVMAQYVLATPEEKRFHYFLFEEGNGVFHLDSIAEGMFRLIPCVNIHSDARLYPYGDTKMYAQLEDLLSVVVTVFLDNAKRINNPIAKVDPQAYEQFRDEIEAALERGGAAPGIENIYQPNQINNAIVLLINYLVGWIQDSSSQHSASMGELPAKQIAKETVQALIAKDRQSHGRKDVMVDAALTDLARLLVKMITLYDDDEEFVPITDPKARFQFVPINKIMTTNEYQTMVMNLSNVPLPTTPEEEMQYMASIPKMLDAFERENDVKVYNQPGYVDETDGTEYFPEQVSQTAMMEQGTEEPDMKAFFLAHPMREAQISVYYVNVLSADINVNVRYTVNTDFASDPQFIANRALELHSRQAMSRVDLAEAMQVPDPSGVVSRADAENKVMQLAQQLAQDTEFYNAVMATLQNVAKAKEKGSQAPKE